MTARHLLIILRTCTRVNMINDTGSGRYIKCSKHELVNRCVSSLIESINTVQGHQVELVILDDNSDSDALADIKTIASKCKFPYTVESVKGGTGNGYTMGLVYNIVENLAKDLWYHVEDDYLHYPEAIHDMLDTVSLFEKETNRMIAINPHDDAWRYRQPYPSYLLFGPYRHYRTVQHTTYTCLASKAIYEKYRNHFQDVVTMTTNGEDWVENKSINLVWNKEDVSLFSPIPGLAFHIMDESGRDPYIDIDERWNSVPKLWLDTDKPRMAIVSLFNERHADLAQHTWYNNKTRYALKHGYSAFAKTDNFSPEQVHFDKFVHILDVMHKNPNIDWVWWLDNDAMITNFDIKIEDLVDNDYHVIMPTDIAALNTGSFLVRNSAQGRAWLEFLLTKKTEYKDDKKWFEQQAVIDFYPKFQELFKLIPQQWLNSYDYKMYNVPSIDLLGQDGQWAPGDFVIHWPGLPNEARVKLAEYYQQFIQDTPK